MGAGKAPQGYSAHAKNATVPVGALASVLLPADEALEVRDETDAAVVTLWRAGAATAPRAPPTGVRGVALEKRRGREYVRVDIGAVSHRFVALGAAANI